MTILVLGHISRDFLSDGAASVQARNLTCLCSLAPVPSLLQAEGVTPQDLPL